MEEPKDVTPPAITLLVTPQYLTVGDTFIDSGASASDDVDGDVDVAVTGTVDSSSIQTFVLTYTAVDSSWESGSAQNTCGHRSGARGHESSCYYAPRS